MEVFLIAAGVSALVGGKVLYDELTPKSQLCYQPAPNVRVCKTVKDSNLEERIAEAMAATAARQRLAEGKIVE